MILWFYLLFFFNCIGIIEKKDSGIDFRNRLWGNMPTLRNLHKAVITPRDARLDSNWRRVLWSLSLHVELSRVGQMWWLKTQLNSTQLNWTKNRQFSVSRDFLSMLRIWRHQKSPANCWLLCRVKSGRAMWLRLKSRPTCTRYTALYVSHAAAAAAASFTYWFVGLFLSASEYGWCKHDAKSSA